MTIDVDVYLMVMDWCAFITGLDRDGSKMLRFRMRARNAHHVRPGEGCVGSSLFRSVLFLIHALTGFCTFCNGRITPSQCINSTPSHHSPHPHPSDLS